MVVHDGIRSRTLGTHPSRHALFREWALNVSPPESGACTVHYRPFSRHAVACRTTTGGKPSTASSTPYHGTFHGPIHSIPFDPIPKPNPIPNLGAVDIAMAWGLPRNAVRLRWSAVAAAAGVAVVPPMACHGTHHGAMDSYVTPWDAVGMSYYAMGGTMAMPRQSQNSSVEPWTLTSKTRISSKIYMIRLHRGMPWYSHGLWPWTLPWHAVEVAVGCRGGRHGMTWALPWRAMGVPLGGTMVSRIACHGMPRGAMPCRGMPWGCHGMPRMVPCGKSHGIPRKIQRLQILSWDTGTWMGVLAYYY